MKTNLKTIGILLTSLVFIGICSCQNCPDNSKTEGTTLKVGKMSILIPKSYKLIKNDATGIMFVKSADSTSVNPAGGGGNALPPIASPATITDSQDTITINPGGKGGTPVTPVTTTSTVTTPTNQ